MTTTPKRQPKVSTAPAKPKAPRPKKKTSDVTITRQKLPHINELYNAVAAIHQVERDLKHHAQTCDNIQDIHQRLAEELHLFTIHRNRLVRELAQGVTALRHLNQQTQVSIEKAVDKVDNLLTLATEFEDVVEDPLLLQGFRDTLDILQTPSKTDTLTILEKLRRVLDSVDVTYTAPPPVDPQYLMGPLQEVKAMLLQPLVAIEAKTTKRRNKNT